MEEFFDVPNPRFKSNAEALAAGFEAMYVLLKPIMLEMMAEAAKGNP